MSKDKNIIDLEIELPSPEQLPEGLQKYFAVCKEKLGLIPNVLKAFCLLYTSDAADDP